MSYPIGLRGHPSSGERRSVSVPISEKITLGGQILHKLSAKLPKWAGKMAYTKGEVSLDARFLGWVVGILITAGLAIGGFGLVQIYQLSGDFREQRQILINDRQNQSNYGLETNRKLDRIEQRLDRLERNRQ